MTVKDKRRLTLAGIVGGSTLVLSGLGAMVNGIVTLDQKVGQRVAVSDSLFHNDSLHDARLERIERRLGIGSKGRRASAKPEQVGLVRRVFRLLF